MTTTVAATPFAGRLVQEAQGLVDEAQGAGPPFV